MSGWTDVPLSPFGRQQIELLGAELSKQLAFAAIYTSPLRRAVDTARELSQSGLGPLRACDSLREIDCGAVDGLPIEAVRRAHPTAWAANLRQTDEDFRWPGGESYREFRRRALSGIRQIAERHPGERVAVVTHAGVISQVIGWLHGISAARWEPFRPGNASLTTVEWSGNAGWLVSFNQRFHLRASTPRQSRDERRQGFGLV